MGKGIPLANVRRRATRTISAALIGCVLGLAALATGGAAAADDSSLGALEGTVTLADGNSSPAANVPVVIDSYFSFDRGRDHIATLNLTTDAAGHYRADNLSLEYEYDVTAGPSADLVYAPTTARTGTLAPGEIRTLNVELPVGAIVRGTVSRVLDQTPVAGATVSFTANRDHPVVTATDASGHYALAAAPGTYVATVAADGLLSPSPLTVPLSSGQHIDNADFGLRAKPVLAGTVTAADDPAKPLAGISVTTNGPDGFATTTDASGHYSITTNQPSSGVTLTFTDASKAYAPVTSRQLTTAPDAKITFDVALQPAGSISGTVTRHDTDPPVPLAGTVVSIGGPFVTPMATTTTGPDGTYRFDGLPASNSYVLTFQGPAGFLTQYWPRSTFVRPLTLAVGQQRTGMDALMETALTAVDVSGRVALGSAEVPGAGTNVQLVRTDGLVTYSLSATSNGTFSFADIPSGDFRVKFTPADPKYRTQYLGGTSDPAKAEILTLLAGRPITGLDITLPEAGITTSRVSGADRFAVGVAVSKAAHSDGADVAYIVTGANYPDALSAGPAAIIDGAPLLLTDGSALTPSVRDELIRLDPEKIVVVGGPNSISDAVLGQLKALQPNTVRVSGRDRFEASRNVAEFAFGASGATHAYIATGTNFPDALSAGAVAGARNAPVVLVDGRGTLDAATTKLLTDLGVDGITIVGGPASVNTGLEAQLKKIAPTDRVGGADRYAVSASLNAGAIPISAQAFLVTGSNFPDALTGSAWAGEVAAPLYVSQPTCVPAAVLGALDQQSVTHVTLIGGPNSLSEDVARLVSC
jgi:putative cell wall-binding protein